MLTTPDAPASTIADQTAAPSMAPSAAPSVVPPNEVTDAAPTAPAETEPLARFALTAEQVELRVANHLRQCPMCEHVAEHREGDMSLRLADHCTFLATEVRVFPRADTGAVALRVLLSVRDEPHGSRGRTQYRAFLGPKEARALAERLLQGVAVCERPGQ